MTWNLQTYMHTIMHTNDTDTLKARTCIDDASEQVVHDARQGLCREHAVQRAHEHGHPRVEPLGRTAHVVAVRDHPWNHLYLQAPAAGAASGTGIVVTWFRMRAPCDYEVMKSVV